MSPKRGGVKSGGGGVKKGGAGCLSVEQLLTDIVRWLHPDAVRHAAAMCRLHGNGAARVCGTEGGDL